jgi:hypothetical protein
VPEALLVVLQAEVEIWVRVALRVALPEELLVELLVAAQELNQRLEREAEVKILLEMSRSVRIELDDDLAPQSQQQPPRCEGRDPRRPVANGQRNHGHHREVAFEARRAKRQR